MSAVTTNVATILPKQFQPVLGVEVEGVPAAAGLRLVTFSGNELMAGVGGFDLALTVGVPGELGGTRFKALFKDKRVKFCVNGHTFAGVVRGGGWVPEEGTLFLRVSPALGRLANSSIDRTWVNKTAPQILKAILKAANIEVDATRLAEARHSIVPFAAQYAERTLHCFARTAEDAGITYIATVRDGLELIVLTDWSAPPAREVRLVARPDGPGAEVAGDGWFQGFVESWGDGPDAVAVSMHDTAMGRVLPANVGTAPADATAGMRLVRSGDGKRVRQAAEARAAALRAGRETAEFVTDMCLSPGTGVRLDGDPRLWLVWTVAHSASEAAGYSGRVVVVPSAPPFAPPRETPRPSVSGYLPARVVGADGKADPGDSNAHAEPDDTVLIRFHFDDPKAEPVRVPVGQPGASRVEHPRVGDEVRITFQDGDIGQPFVDGALPPVAARLAHSPRAYPDAASTVFRPTSGNDARDATVVRVRTVNGKQKVGAAVAGDLDVLIRKDLRLATNGALHQTVGTDARVKAGGSLLLRAVKNLFAKVGEAFGLEVSGNSTFKARKILLSADESIELVCGGTCIRLTPSLLLLISPLVDINPPGATAGDAGGNVSVDDPAPPNPNL
jgi:type VI secretion system secreted protein VgrG